MTSISYYLRKSPDYQQPGSRISRKLLTIALLIMGGLLFSNATFAEEQTEEQNSDTQNKFGSLLLFPSLHADHRAGLSNNSKVKRNQAELGVDLFYSNDFSSTRIIVEAFISDDEQEIERIQVGWSLNPDTMLWVGRFHRPIGYWNSQYHHGSYLQTSVDRPGIVEYEDDAGLLPTHTTGLMLESTQTVGESAFKYYLTVGAGPEFNTDENLLEALNVLHPDDGSHKLSTLAKLAYLPDELATTELGIFFGNTIIPVRGISNGEISQSLVGSYFHGKLFNTGFTGALFNVNNDNSINGVQSSGSFTSAYLQGEYELNTRWVLYSRIEGITNPSSDPYLSFFPAFVKRKKMAGIRYDFLHRHAITLELSQMRRANSVDDHFHTSVQWSAVFP